MGVMLSIYATRMFFGFFKLVYRERAPKVWGKMVEMLPKKAQPIFKNFLDS